MGRKRNTSFAHTHTRRVTLSAATHATPQLHHHHHPFEFRLPNFYIIFLPFNPALHWEREMQQVVR